jgi:hypothetical protein
MVDHITTGHGFESMSGVMLFDQLRVDLVNQKLQHPNEGDQRRVNLFEE